METRTIEVDGQQYEIAVVSDGQQEAARITKDGTEIRRVTFRRDQDISVTLLDLLESDIRNGIVR